MLFRGGHKAKLHRKSCGRKNTCVSVDKAYILFFWENATDPTFKILIS